MRKRQQVQNGWMAAAWVEPLEGRTLMAGDVVLEWNQLAVEATKAERLVPPRQVQTLAMVQAAVFDAVNGVERGYDPYLVKRHAPTWASPEAAAAAAAYGVLSELLPASRPTLDAALASSLAAVPDGGAEDAGLAYGRLVADRMLAERRDDGIDVPVQYVPGSEPDDWQPTPPAFAPAMLPQFAGIEPFAIPSPHHFRAAPPPTIDSAEFTQAFDEVKAIGAANSATRTAEQREIAVYWAGPGGTVQPPGHWNRIARTVATTQGNTLAQNARLLALLNVGMADALISSWETKYTYNYLRPVTAIRNADNDGNPDTAADPTWSPLLGTPPFPAYTSGHSTVSAAAATVLANFFGTDAISFTDTSEGLPGGPTITRSFEGFWEAAEDAGVSRVYGGIHWSFDNREGLAAGRDVGGFIADNLLRPRGAARGGDDRRRDNDGGAATTRCATDGPAPISANPHSIFFDRSDRDLLNRRGHAPAFI